MKIAKLSMAVLLATSLYAKESKSLADVTISGGATNIKVNEITGAEVETDPIFWYEFNAVLHIGGFSPSFGYSRSFSGDNTDNTGKQTDTQSSERIIISIPFDKLGLEGFKLNYTKYSFNTYFTAKDRNIILIDSSNETAKTGTISLSDQGVSVATIGMTLGLRIESERIEFIGPGGKPFAGNPNSYVGIFAERLYKPWEDPTTTWRYSDGTLATVVYSEAEFLALGFTFGANSQDSQLKAGWNVKSIGIDIAWLDINLTDNYKFSDKLGENMQAYKMGLKTEIAYKVPTTFLGKNSALILAGFVNYDYYYLDTDTTNNNSNNSNDTIDLSDDFLYGVRASLNF